MGIKGLAARLALLDAIVIDDAGLGSEMGTQAIFNFGLAV
jgi:hypothetical protein